MLRSKSTHNKNTNLLCGFWAYGFYGFRVKNVDHVVSKLSHEAHVVSKLSHEVDPGLCVAVYFPPLGQVAGNCSIVLTIVIITGRSGITSQTSHGHKTGNKIRYGTQIK